MGHDARRSFILWCILFGNIVGIVMHPVAYFTSTSPSGRCMRTRRVALWPSETVCTKVCAGTSPEERTKRCVNQPARCPTVNLFGKYTPCRIIYAADLAFDAGARSPVKKSCAPMRMYIQWSTIARACAPSE